MWVQGAEVQGRERGGQRRGWQEGRRRRRCLLIICTGAGSRGGGSDLRVSAVPAGQDTPLACKCDPTPTLSTLRPHIRAQGLVADQLGFKTELVSGIPGGSTTEPTVSAFMQVR